MKLIRKWLRKVLLVEDKSFDEVRAQRHKAQEALSEEIEQTKTVIVLDKTPPNYRAAK